MTRRGMGVAGCPNTLPMATAAKARIEVAAAEGMRIGAVASDARILAPYDGIVVGVPNGAGADGGVRPLDDDEPRIFDRPRSRRP